VTLVAVAATFCGTVGGSSSNGGVWAVALLLQSE
jgi:hypothetical protein